MDYRARWRRSLPPRMRTQAPPRDTDLRRVLLRGRCSVCLKPVELVAGCEWVMPGTWERCDHLPPKEQS